MNISLNSDVRILFSSNSICFRKGIWDYYEVWVDLSSESEKLTKVIFDIAYELQKTGVTFVDTDCYSLTEEDLNKLSNVVQSLMVNQILIDSDRFDVNAEITKILTGNLYQLSEKKCSVNDKVLMITDNEYVAESAVKLADVIDLSLTVANTELLGEMKSLSNCQKVDGINYEKNLTKIGALITDYSVIVICQARLDVLLVRMINECISQSLNQKRLLLGFVDGPFLHVCSLTPPITADFDSLERRVLARLEDTALYQMFINQEQPFIKNLNKGFVPVMNILMNLLVSEAVLIINTGSSKFEGRLLSIYVPTFEIQVQDILKLSTSSTQGVLAKSAFRLQQIATRRLVNDIVKRDR